MFVLFLFRLIVSANFFYCLYMCIKIFGNRRKSSDLAALSLPKSKKKYISKGEYDRY